MDEEGGKMIGLQHLVMAIMCGAVLMLVGLAPGLFAALVMGVHNFSESVSRRRAPAMEVRQPRWLASAGFGLIVCSLLAYSL